MSIYKEEVDAPYGTEGMSDYCTASLAVQEPALVGFNASKVAEQCYRGLAQKFA